MPENRPRLDRAILWVAHPALLWQRVAGMSCGERQLFTAARAGIRTIWVGAPKPEPEALSRLRLPPGLEIRWSADGDVSRECAPPYLGISADHFVRVEALKYVLRQDYAQSVSFEDASGLSVIQVVLRPDEAVAARKLTLPPDSCRRLEAPIAGTETIEWLMLTGPKAQDGFMARHFDRHLSLAVSSRLLDTFVTPNHMTLLSTLIGLTGASFFLGDTRSAYVCGALLVWLHSVLDGCDGEIARVRFEETPLGSDLDFWGDNLVHAALFTCLGVGLWLGGNGPHVLILAGLAVAAAIASAWTAWQHRLSRRGASAPEAGVTDQAAGDGLDSKLSRLENTLAQRDFIYLLLILALLDCVYEFLWAAAIGGVLFFAIMLYLRRVNDNDQARRPHPAR